MKKYTQKECQIHGQTQYILEGRGYYRCKQCRIDAVTKRRREIKKQLVQYKGGQCEKCGYKKCIAALEFHHLDPNEKDFAISKNGHNRSIEIAKKEVDKCTLLCSNCHKEVHNNVL